MKKYFYFFTIFLFAAANYVMAVCPSGHPITMDSPGIPNCNCTTRAGNFWCLGCGTTANNGSNQSWLFCDAGNYCYFDGNWSSPGVLGCCGMWDIGSCESRTMMAKIDQNINEGTSTHRAEYVALVREKSLTIPSYNFPIFDFASIPGFHISAANSTGPGGVTTLSFDGWSTSYPGPAHYKARLQTNTDCTDCTLNPICAPGGNSPCPPPISGYRIVATTAGCADGTCDNPTPAPPPSGLPSAWNLTVTNGIINNRVPTFPIIGVQIQNPATCNASNRYIYIATLLRYADGYQSAYVSGNSFGVYWCGAGVNPAEAGKSMQCQKAGTDSITCTYANGGSCTTNNTIYYGPLSNVGTYGYTSSLCSIDTSGSTTFSLGSGDWFWVFVSTNGTKEGSYGKNSSGTERLEATGIGSCDLPQDLTNTCS